MKSDAQTPSPERACDAHNAGVLPRFLCGAACGIDLHWAECHSGVPEQQEPEVVRHHFVPCFLLRSWSEESSDDMLQEFRLDLEELPTYRRAPKGTGFQDDLYALTKPMVAGMSQNSIENHLWSPIDNRAALVRAKMVQQGTDSLSTIERCDWARFLMSLRLRQPDQVSKLTTESAEHLRQTLAHQPEQYEALAQAGDAPTLEEWTENKFPGLIENFGKSLFRNLIEDRVTGTKILRLRWRILDLSGGKHELLLADNPCIFVGGIDAPDLIIALPLSPTEAFLATRTNRTAFVLGRQDARSLAVRLNESSILQARARVYARNATPARFIENRRDKFFGTPPTRALSRSGAPRGTR